MTAGYNTPDLYMSMFALIHFDAPQKLALNPITIYPNPP
jgi:hypothetical protein